MPSVQCVRGCKEHLANFGLLHVSTLQDEENAGGDDEVGFDDQLSSVVKKALVLAPSGHALDRF